MTSRSIITIASTLCMLASPGTQAQPLGVETGESNPSLSLAKVIRVGPTREIKLPSAAARVARDGDVIEIDAGTYEGDAAVWKQNRLTIRGVGGRAHLRANGAHVEEKGIWVIKGTNTTVENIEFSGATVRHRNGAGIRLEGPGLTVRNCYFHGNENGILTGANPRSDILIEHSEFAQNGFGDGYSHNIYVGTVRSFALRYSYVHRAVVGHNVKSRALRNEITYNRIMDEDDGRSSYAIDLPNGGLSYIIGNVLQQGPSTENTAIVAYGAEGLKNPVNELYLASNTLVDDLPTGGRFVYIEGIPSVVRIVNNIFSGPGDVLSGRGELVSNQIASKTDFVNPALFDYRLRPHTPAVRRGIDPGRANGFDLRPAAEYLHKAQRRARRSELALYVGAFAPAGTHDTE